MADLDRRDETTWVVISLSANGERCAEAGALDRCLRRALNVDGSHQIFIPYATFVHNERRSVLNVIEGYAFIASGLPDSAYLSLPAKTPYVSSVIHSTSPKSFPVLNTVSDLSVRSLRDNLSKMISREIEEGSKVIVSEGFYLGMVGVVIGFTSDIDVLVLIDLRSIKAVKRIPRFHLRPAEGLIGFNADTEYFPAHAGEDDEEHGW